ncbi:hypothetical protein [Bifidobacterium tissieri]|uniref:Uncharacterized protein n=1 Tax=Bifidobacterium tissieri TaxID=1630162 RepID=A0A5M9ZVH7_9BIFI|nr:hypothetical protein [Bifidobacterium tissieri]KAA8829324.1 hypothetical protein EM849_10970 [Bifidobacterium tissieri]KAA8831637.1 hypothetical protein EMO89_02610 [Bifidobacterium tissieri]
MDNTTTIPTETLVSKLVDSTENRDGLIEIGQEAYAEDGSCEFVGAVYDMDDFDDFMSGMKPFDVACRVAFGDFNPMSGYFTFDRYENLKSLDSWEIEDRAWTIRDEIIDWAVRNIGVAELFGRLEFDADTDADTEGETD